MKQLKMIILLTVLLGMVGAKAFAYDFEVDGIYYNYSSDDGNSVYVTYKSRNEVTYTGDIVVPSSVSHMGNTYKVVAIGEYAFLQQNVNGYYRSITSISLPNTIKTIGVYAFSSNKELGSISIPASVTEIKDWAFDSCEGLTTVVLQKGLNKIAGCAFMNCSSLSNINIPNGVTTIGHNAFTFCDIKELFLPKTVTELGINPFGCRNLASIIVDDENTVYDSRHNCNAIIETATNKLISGCINTDIPSSVQTIGGSSFRNIERPSLIIPEGVANIEKYAFLQSHILSISIPSSVTSISLSYGNWGDAKIVKANMPILPKLSESITDGGVLKNIVLYVPKGCKPLYEEAPYWKDFGGIREMGETQPGAHVLSFKDQLVKALCVSQWDTDNDGELSEEEAATVTSIGAAFMGQEITSFDEFQYFTGVKEIEYQAFKDCRVLTSIIIPQSVNSIGSSAFFGCTGFISVVSMIKEPFAINPRWIWDGVKVDEIPLYVPKGTKGLYEATEGWNVFKNIVEMEDPDEVTITDVSKMVNAIYIEPANALVGNEVSLQVNLKNANAATSYGFELVLPEGLSISTMSDGSFDDAITMSTRHKGHTLTTNKLAGNTYKVAVASISSKALSDNDGLVLTIKARVADNMAVGDYPIKVQSPLIVNTDGTKPPVQDTQSKITIEDYVKGDVDGDGVVDLADAVLVINHYVGKPVATFNDKAADVDGDGVIDLADAVLIINYYVGKIDTLAPVMEFDGPEPQ